MRGVTSNTDFPRMSCPSTCDMAAFITRARTAMQHEGRRETTASRGGKRRQPRAGGKPDLDQDVALFNRAISGSRARGHEALDHERPMRWIIDAKRDAHPTLCRPGMRGSACAAQNASLAGTCCRAVRAHGGESAPCLFAQLLGGSAAASCPPLGAQHEGYTHQQKSRRMLCGRTPRRTGHH